MASGVNGNSLTTERATQQRSVAVKRTNLISLERVYEAVDGILHLVGTSAFLLVFLWHWTPEAQVLPGASGYGWFFKYLTFWGWTFQTFQYLLATLYLPARTIARTPSPRPERLSGRALFAQHMVRVRVVKPKTLHSPRRHLVMVKSEWWARCGTFVDDISCVAFCFATVVTAQFWALHVITGGLVERSEDRPPWLGFMVHVSNALFAWLDVILSHPRTFSARSRNMSYGVAAAYCVQLALCRYLNGRYPYPFMNTMPPVFSFVLMVSVSLVVLTAVHELGLLLSIVASKALAKERTATAPPSKGKARLR